MAVQVNLAKALDKAYEDKTVKEILDAPPSALAGSDAVGSRLQIYGVHLPIQFLGMLPYVVTIVVVAGALGRAVAPAAVGRPYRKS